MEKLEPVGQGRAIVPVWDCWRELLPAHPRATDVFAEGVRRMDREDALRQANIEFNSDDRVQWLNFDIDTPDAFDALDRSNLPMPNIFVQNPANGHGHALFAIKGFVGLTDASRRAPMKLAADVQLGMTRRLGADLRYSNRFAKNPLCRRWRASFLASQRYDLSDLLAALDRADIRRAPERLDMAGLSRNCDIFDAARVWAYSRVRDAKCTMTFDQWQRAVFAEVAIYNIGFSLPLPLSETRQIAKSIAGWTWRKFSRAKFSQIQSGRRLKGAAAQQLKTRSAIESVAGYNPDTADVLPVPRGAR